MYPAAVASSSYRPQLPQQPSQLIPQTNNQNIHPPFPAPPSSSSYPYPQHNYNVNTPASGHPGQPPLYPQTMPAAMGNSATNQQNNSVNGPPVVSISLLFSSKLSSFLTE